MLIIRQIYRFWSLLADYNEVFSNLIRETFNYSFTFQHTGLARGKMKDQLLNFRASLQTASGKKYTQFKNWYEAFFALEEWLGSLHEGKKIVFFDELPWIDTPRSNFISGLEHFWNSRVFIHIGPRRDIATMVRVPSFWNTKLMINANISKCYSEKTDIWPLVRNRYAHGKISIGSPRQIDKISKYFVTLHSDS